MKAVCLTSTIFVQLLVAIVFCKAQGSKGQIIQIIGEKTKAPVISQIYFYKFSNVEPSVKASYFKLTSGCDTIVRIGIWPTDGEHKYNSFECIKLPPTNIVYVYAARNKIQIDRINQRRRK